MGYTNVRYKCYDRCYRLGAHSGPTQTTMMELFCENINGWTMLSIFAKKTPLIVNSFRKKTLS